MVDTDKQFEEEYALAILKYDLNFEITDATGKWMVMAFSKKNLPFAFRCYRFNGVAAYASADTKLEAFRELVVMLEEELKVMGRFADGL